jgi:4-hydroxy-tetrahydrodipicolinate reductase
MTIRVCLAGATGWAGSALARSIAGLEDIKLVSAVSRTHAGKALGDVLAEPRLTASIYATAEKALTANPCDVFFEFTKPDVAKLNVLTALENKAHVVVGTSGLTDDDYKFSEIAAKFIPQWEIIDYASDAKKDSPSGTVRELAYRLSQIRESELTVPLEKTLGVKETRGARMTGSQVHSVRLPSYTISAEVIFGMSDQKLTIRHDSGTSAQPYVDGSLLAIRKVNTFVGLHRGLDSVLDLS